MTHNDFLEQFGKLHVTRHMSHVTRHTSHVTRHTPHATHPPSPSLITPPRQARQLLLHVILRQRQGAHRVRAGCLQRKSASDNQESGGAGGQGGFSCAVNAVRRRRGEEGACVDATARARALASRHTHTFTPTHPPLPHPDRHHSRVPQEPQRHSLPAVGARVPAAARGRTFPQGSTPQHSR